jgi:hypothetical protein
MELLVCGTFVRHFCAALSRPPNYFRKKRLKQVTWKTAAKVLHKSAAQKCRKP